MEDKKNIVIRLRYSASDKKAEPDVSASKVTTEWNVKRILLAMVGVVLFIEVLFFLFKPDTQNTVLQPVTMLNIPVKKAPEKTDFLPQENQSGAGKETKKPEMTTQKFPSKANSQVKQIKEIVPVETKPKVAQKIITQPKAEKKVVTAGKTAVASRPEKSPHITAESLQQQIAQLGTATRQSQPSADKAKIKFVNSVSTHKYVAAQYMKDWETKVERMGNLNYRKRQPRKNSQAH